LLGSSSRNCLASVKLEVQILVLPKKKKEKNPAKQIPTKE
jgi:hypothetical protein